MKYTYSLTIRNFSQHT